MPSLTPPDLRRSCPVELDKPRRLRYNFAALALLDERYGINLLETDEAALEATFKHPAALMRILWAGCVHEDPSVTPEQLAEHLGLAELKDVMEAVTAAIKLSQKSKLAEDAAVPLAVAEEGMVGVTSSAVPTAPSDYVPGSCMP